MRTMHRTALSVRARRSDNMRVSITGHLCPAARPCSGSVNLCSMIPELLFLPPSGAEWGSLADIALQLILDERTRKGESEGRECGGSRPSHVLGSTLSTVLGPLWCLRSGGGQLSTRLQLK